jgi:hypothetical protein
MQFSSIVLTGLVQTLLPENVAKGRLSKVLLLVYIYGYFD